MGGCKRVGHRYKRVHSHTLTVQVSTGSWKHTIGLHPTIIHTTVFTHTGSADVLLAAHVFPGLLTSHPHVFTHCMHRRLIGSVRAVGPAISCEETTFCYLPHLFTHCMHRRLIGSVRAVGPAISCEGTPYRGNEDAEWRRNPHVQSYLLATDR